MSAPSRYPKNKNHPSTYYTSLASPAPIRPTDAGDLYGSGSGMGPPPLEYPPQVLEIDPSTSTTLPSPPICAAWNSPTFPLRGFSDESTYGPTTAVRQVPLENYSRGTAQNNPLYSWYNENDGPWIPKSTISELPEEKTPRALPDNRLQFQHANPYRQRVPSDAGTYPFGVPASDSGYGTRRSDGNASVFSVEIPDRDQDGQNLAGTVADFERYPVPGAGLEHRDSLLNPWATLPDAAVSGDQYGKGFLCLTCSKRVKTRSELKKHDLRHRKPFKCDYPVCPRVDGFSTMNDLVRHKASKHPSIVQQFEGMKRYRCHVHGCKSKEKSWPRLDNFRSHLKRVHKRHFTNDDEIEAMAKLAEYVEPATPNVSHCHDFGHSISLAELVQAPSTAHHNSPKSHVLSTKWKDSYPEDTESLHYSFESKKRPSDDLDKDAPVDELLSTYESSEIDTIQPSDILSIPRGGQEEWLTQGMLSTLVSLKEMQSKASDPSVHLATRGARLSPQGKAEVCRTSALDAIAEVIKATFACGSALTKNNDRTVHQNPEWILSNRNSSAEHICEAGPSSLVSSNSADINLGVPPPSSESSIDAEAQSKAIEVLKILHDFGYIVQRDPNHSIKPRNPGSVASSKSENLVTCQECGKFKGRPCELKKHMKRHSRPYACTFSVCNNKTFGSKNDWKRHENSQHFHLESWRCDEEKSEGGICAKVCYRKQLFMDHLQIDHLISNDASIESKIETCHIGHNGQERFWCGFCVKLIDLKQKGTDAWAERFDHIDNHFMGRHGFTQQSIQDWVPVDSGDKPKSGVPSLLDAKSISRRETPEDSCQSPDLKSNASSPESTGLAGPSSGGSTTITVSQGGLKRKHTTDDDDNKRARKQRSRASTGNYVVYCCQCHTSHNPKLDQNCSLCNDSHRFCDNCAVELQ